MLSPFLSTISYTYTTLELLNAFCCLFDLRLKLLHDASDLPSRVICVFILIIHSTQKYSTLASYCHLIYLYVLAYPSQFPPPVPIIQSHSPTNRLSLRYNTLSLKIITCLYLQQNIWPSHMGMDFCPTNTPTLACYSF